MKKTLLTLGMISLWLCSWAQERNPIKIVRTNEFGVIDTSSYQGIEIKNPFKETKYYKGRILVKFNDDALNPELVGDKEIITDVAALVGRNSKIADTSSLFAELVKEIKSFKMLTGLPKEAKQKKEEQSKDSVGIKPFEDIFYLAMVYCEEGKEEVLANKLIKLGLVDYAEPDQIVELNTIPNDPQYFMQRGLNQYYTDVVTAWETQAGSPNVKVAILDTGIDYNNDDLGNGWKYQ